MLPSRNTRQMTMPASVAAHRDPRHTSEGGSSTDWSLPARVWVDTGERHEVGNRVVAPLPLAPGLLAGWWRVLNAPAVEAIRATYPELRIADSQPHVDGRRRTRKDKRADALAG